jgi:hypothetical protein
MTDREIDAKFNRQPHLVIAAAGLGAHLGWAGAHTCPTQSGTGIRHGFVGEDGLWRTGFQRTVTAGQRPGRGAGTGGDAC